MSSDVLGFQEIDRTQIAVGGGKAANLAELSRIEGIRVPAGFVVSTRAFARIVGEIPRRPGMARSASRPEGGRSGEDRRSDPRAPAGHRSDRHPGGPAGGDFPPSGPPGRAGGLRRPLQRHRGGPADGIFRRAAGHLSERHRQAGDPAAHQPVLGLALHRSGRHLPPAERLRPPSGPPGGDRPADDLPPGGRDHVHRRPGHLQPQDLHHRCRLRPGRGAGLRPGEPRHLQGPGGQGDRQEDIHQEAGHPGAARRRHDRAGAGARSARPANPDR